MLTFIRTNYLKEQEHITHLWLNNKLNKKAVLSHGNRAIRLYLPPV